MSSSLRASRRPAAKHKATRVAPAIRTRDELRFELERILDAKAAKGASRVRKP